MTATKWWIFHGLQDNIVDPTLSREMAAALRSAGADVKLSLYPNDNNNSWHSAFSEPELLPWLFSAKKESAAKKENPQMAAAILKSLSQKIS